MDGCVQAEIKNKKINWKKRKELLKLLDKFRKHDGSYDCLVPGSVVKIVFILPIY